MSGQKSQKEWQVWGVWNAKTKRLVGVKTPFISSTEVGARSDCVLPHEIPIPVRVVPVLGKKA